MQIDKRRLFAPQHAMPRFEIVLHASRYTQQLVNGSLSSLSDV